MSHLPVQDAAPELVSMALSRAGPKSDNVTVLAVEWNSLKQPNTLDTLDGSSFTETHTMANNVFASTILPDQVEPSNDDFDEDTIERSIAEINEAIARTVRRF
jgi:hypothetical protein